MCEHFHRVGFPGTRSGKGDGLYSQLAEKLKASGEAFRFFDGSAGCLSRYSGLQYNSCSAAITASFEEGVFPQALDRGKYCL